jgi:hypothetical protein
MDTMRFSYCSCEAINVAPIVTERDILGLARWGRQLSRPMAMIDITFWWRHEHQDLMLPETC